MAQTPTGAAATAASSTIALTAAQTPHFENGMAILLNTWPALSLAVENEFGGPDSADKRDWMCGAVADLFSCTISHPLYSNLKAIADVLMCDFTADPATDEEDLETFLLQILEDEFETALEDDSAFAVAQRVILLRRQCAADDLSGVQALQSMWEKVGKNKPRVQVVREGDAEDDDDEEDSEGEDEENDDAMDVDAGEEAPQLVAVKERVEKVVDEDGFELVQKKGRRTAR
ncbi:hypothetical protein Dda_1179 [Drechslerella dactyloides]|uniref:Pre-rRNA-processing protein TSR2 n=1 Tax=Drechslerella dactyloides TaxID=74499 RepID=A0AAD6J7C2_DREDA|nr:hypothetical protein Dda_1179 [Drechslerella dactyloides]